MTERFGWDRDYFEIGKVWRRLGLPRPDTQHIGDGWDAEQEEFERCHIKRDHCYQPVITPGRKSMSTFHTSRGTRGQHCQPRSGQPYHPSPARREAIHGRIRPMADQSNRIWYWIALALASPFLAALVMWR